MGRNLDRRSLLRGSVATSLTLTTGCTLWESDPTLSGRYQGVNAPIPLKTDELKNTTPFFSTVISEKEELRDLIDLEQLSQSSRTFLSEIDFSDSFLTIFMSNLSFDKPYIYSDENLHVNIQDDVATFILNLEQWPDPLRNEDYFFQFGHWKTNGSETPSDSVIELEFQSE